MKGKDYYSIKKEEVNNLDKKNKSIIDLDYLDIFINKNKKDMHNGIVYENFITERNSLDNNKEFHNISDTGKPDNRNLSITDRYSNGIKTTKKGNKQLRLIKNTNRNEKFANFYNRLMAFDDERKNMIEEKRKEKEKEEEKKYRKVPQISGKSKIIYKHTDEKVYERCLRFKKETQKKKDDMIKGKNDKIKEEEDKILNIKHSHKIDPNKIDEKIRSLIEWEKKKNKKIIKIREDLEKQKDSENTFRPNVNRTKTSHTPEPVLKDNLCYTSNNVELTERLYTLDLEKRKKKHEQLEGIYKPSFQPMTNGTKHLKKRDLTPTFNKKNDKREVISKDFSELYVETLRDNSIQSILKEKIHFNRNKNK